MVAGVCQEVQNPELLSDGEDPVCWMIELSLKQHPGFWHERLYFPDVSFVRWEGDSESLVPVQRCRKTGWGLWLDRTVITAPPEVLGSSEGDVDPGESSCFGLTGFTDMDGEFEQPRTSVFSVQLKKENK